MDVPFAQALLSAYVRFACRRKPVEPVSTLRLSTTTRVLLVLTTGMGDTVLSTPVFRAVRQALPNAQIALFVRSSWACLVSAESDINEIISYHGKWRKFFLTLRRLRMFSPQLTLVLHGNDPDILPLAYLAGSRHIVRIPTSGTCYPYLLSNRDRAADLHPLPNTHYIDNRLRILASVGIPIAGCTPSIHVSDEDQQTASIWRNRQSVSDRYVIVHPWAADNYKTWPIAQVRQFLVRACRRWPEISFVLTGAPSDQANALTLSEGIANTVVAAGFLDLATTAALIARANVTIAPDTGILHLAAALNIPTIGLYAPTKPSLVGPRASSAPVNVIEKPLTCTPCLEKHCPYNPATCMTQFTVEDIEACLDPLLTQTA